VQIAVVLIVAAVAALINHFQRPGTVNRPTEANVPAAAAARSDVGFRSRGALEDHFRKHGREFGPGLTVEEYLRRAQMLRDAPVGGPILELTRGDRVTCRFDRRTGDFLAFNPDRTIRTFFRPNDGEAYFRRQAQRTD
jgi:pyocin large subunit-like protein